MLSPSRSELVDIMAADLRRYEATRSESDAMRCLLGLRCYRSGDIVTLIDDALFEARQSAVATTMARS
jgi:hypothetical protein